MVDEELAGNEDDGAEDSDLPLNLGERRAGTEAKNG